MLSPPKLPGYPHQLSVISRFPSPGFRCTGCGRGRDVVHTFACSQPCLCPFSSRAAVAIILITPEALLRCLVFPLVCQTDSEPRLSPLGSSVVRCSDLLLACHRAPRSLSLGDVAFSMLMVWVSDLCTEYEFFPKLMFVLSCGSLTMETLGTFIKSAFLNTSWVDSDSRACSS